MSQPPSPSPPATFPFEFFCSLINEISKIQPRKPGAAHRGNDHPALRIFTRWTARLRQLHSDNLDTASVFRLLFPEEDTRRKYGFQEQRLARALYDALGVHYTPLLQWNSSSGCLGEELRKFLAPSHPPHLDPSLESSVTHSTTLAHVDELLDELASLSAFSHASVRFGDAKHKAERRTRRQILVDLFRPLSSRPLEAAVLVQIILKDLRPLLYPHPVQENAHYTAALIGFNTLAVRELGVHEAMKVWDPSGKMGELWRRTGDLEAAAAGCGGISKNEEGGRGQEEGEDKELVKVGEMVAIPKSEKGRSCEHALAFFTQHPHCHLVWAETKYDGERAQIHVERDGNRWKIRIFSKSRRESTDDRKGVHTIIRDALGLSPGQVPRIQRNVILDAEMVAHNSQGVDEFWKIRGLIETTAYGPRYRGPTKPSPPSPTRSTQSTTLPAHLALVFFDILLLDSESLLSTPYARRREILESTIITTPTLALIAARIAIPLTPSYPRGSSVWEGGKHGGVGGGKEEEGGGEEEFGDALRLLEHVFAEHNADHEEGIVIKADQGIYPSSALRHHSVFRPHRGFGSGGASRGQALPWVKMKKDYIDGYGDALDVVLVGAGWAKERGRGMRVGPGVWTGFWVGIEVGKKESRPDPRKPHFLVYWTVDWGLSREQMEEANFMVRASGNPMPSEELLAKQRKGKNTSLLPYTFTLAKTIPAPAVFLGTPFVGEVFGAGFTKGGSKYYELRFPRLSKLHRPSERPWRPLFPASSQSQLQSASRGGVDVEGLDPFLTAGPTIPELESIARVAVGRERKGKEEDEWSRELWGLAGECSPRVKSAEGRKARVETWLKRLRGRSPERSEGRELKRRRVEPEENGADRGGVECDGENPFAPAWRSLPLAVLTSPSLISREIGRGVVNPDFEEQNVFLAGLPPSSSPPESVRNMTTPSPRSSPLLVQVTKPTAPDFMSPDFLANALVWFARSRSSVQTLNGAMPFLSSEGLQIWTCVPRERRLHSLESMLVGCGWARSEPEGDISGPSGGGDDGSPSIIREGLVVIDERPGEGNSSKKWAQWVIGVLSGMSAGMDVGCSEGRKRKRIWLGGFGGEKGDGRVIGWFD